MVIYLGLTHSLNMTIDMMQSGGNLSPAIICVRAFWLVPKHCRQWLNIFFTLCGLNLDHDQYMSMRHLPAQSRIIRNSVLMKFMLTTLINSKFNLHILFNCL